MMAVGYRVIRFVLGEHFFSVPYTAVRAISRAVYMSGTLHLLAVAEQSSGDGGSGFQFDPSSIINAGTVGLIAFAFFTDRVFTAKAYAKVEAQRDKAEQQRDELIKQQFDDVLPLLSSLKDSLIPLMTKVSTHFDEEHPTKG